VQVDPIKPTLKAPNTKRLKLKSGEPPSNLAFKFNLRRFILEQYAWTSLSLTVTCEEYVENTNFFPLTQVGRCRLT
jgi:hypothetical protein